MTGGGIVFAAASDDRFHAYDSRTGKLLWETRMSASANAGPMTYMGKDGRQYVVIAAGGPGNSRRPSPRENFLYHQTLVAFALPRPADKPVDIVTPYPRRALRGKLCGRSAPLGLSPPLNHQRGTKRFQRNVMSWGGCSHRDNHRPSDGAPPPPPLLQKKRQSRPASRAPGPDTSRLDVFAFLASVRTIIRKGTIMTIGTVKFFNSAKGFGFIAPEGWPRTCSSTPPRWKPPA